ncbi:MAG: TIM barrel protein [Candidatus Aenigmarchaeota archaeon]|nr:TIM barrel protein [Candidatus Aenigmarchaeota archaeon]
MKDLLFGTAGIPWSAKSGDTMGGIKEVKKLGLGSMELEFVRSINIRESKTPEVKTAAEKENIVLSAHGPYWVNLNAQKRETLEASRRWVLQSGRTAALCGAWSICFHAAYYMKQPHGSVYGQVKKELEAAVKQLRGEGLSIWIRPELGGKMSQFGGLEEIVRISAETEGVMPCIDFAHQHARSMGKHNSYNDWSADLALVEKHLGREGLENMHIHAAGIEYGMSGERNHVNLNDCKLNYTDLVQAWKDYKIKGVVISESPNIEEDALLLQKTYNELK